jgi:hypothetical protein
MFPFRFYEPSVKKSTKEPLSMPSYSFRARYPNVTILPNDEVMEILASHEKCPRTTFVWSGEFEAQNEAGEYVYYYVAGDGSLYSGSTPVVILEK